MTTSIVFITGDSCNRDGTEEDVNAIVDTFRNTLKSEVHNWMDIPHIQLQNQLRELKRNQEWLDKFEEYNFVAIFCLAHGASDDQICLENGLSTMHVANFKSKFLKPLFEIAELDGTLKWLIVQSCRGNLNDLVYAASISLIVLYRDFYLISYCTGEGTLSAQDNVRGKVFIQELCKEIVKNAQTKPVIEMILNVNSAVKKYASDKNYQNFSRPVLVRNCPQNYKLIMPVISSTDTYRCKDTYTQKNKKCIII